MATMITEVYEAFRKVGIPDPEAKHAAEALSAENVSTKADINGAEKRLGERISREVAALDDKLSLRINDLDEKLSDRMTALDDKLSPKIAKLERDMAVMKWMMGTTIAGILFLIGGVVSIAIKLFF